MDSFYLLLGFYVLMCIIASVLANMVGKLRSENSKLKSDLSETISRFYTTTQARDEWSRMFSRERRLVLSLREANSDFANVNIALREENERLKNYLSNIANVNADLREENKDLKSQVAFNRSEAERFRSDRAEWFGKYVALLKEHKILKKCLEIKDAHIDSLNLMQGLEDDRVEMLEHENRELKKMKPKYTITEVGVRHGRLSFHVQNNVPEHGQYDPERNSIDY